MTKPTITIQCPNCKKFSMHPYNGSFHPKLVKDIDHFQCASCRHRIDAKNKDYSEGFNKGFKEGWDEDKERHH